MDTAGRRMISVNRRTGGLEIQWPVIALVRYVNRRTGGLENCSQHL